VDRRSQQGTMYTQTHGPDIVRAAVLNPLAYFDVCRMSSPSSYVDYCDSRETSPSEISDKHRHVVIFFFCAFVCK
jgi:hypothetical protein